MADELKTLETELIRLRPAEPSAALRHRIGADLVAVRRRVWQAPWFWGVVLPVAAALVVLFAEPWRRRGDPLTGARQMPGGAPASAAAPVLKPVAVENLLCSAEDEGIVTLADGTPARRERLQYVDTITWRDARTNASLKWTVPREEVRVVPVSFQ